MRILVSGFKPFLGESINPSERLVQYIHSQQQKCADVQSRILKDETQQTSIYGKHHISTVVLPVEFENAFVQLKQKIDLENPDVIFMLGQAGGRPQISLEKIALNWNQARAADEVGFVPPLGKIDSTDKNLAIMTDFPVDDLMSFLNLHKRLAGLSFSAGTFVCNNLYYKVLRAFPKIPALFIHVPFLPEQCGNYLEDQEGSAVKNKTPTMEFLNMAEVLEDILIWTTKKKD